LHPIAFRAVLCLLAATVIIWCLSWLLDFSLSSALKITIQPLPSKAASSASPALSAAASAAASPSTKRHHKKIKVGDRVPIVDFGLHHQKDAAVLAISLGSTENDYRIALDKESHHNKEVTVTVPHSQKFPILMPT